MGWGIRNVKGCFDIGHRADREPYRRIKIGMTSKKAKHR